MKKYYFLKWFILSIAIAINLFILVNACLNGETSAKESTSIAQTTADVINTIKPQTITPQNFDKFAFDFRKLVGHYGLFVLSGAFSSWALHLFVKDKKIGYFGFQAGISLGFGFLFAATTELIQKFVAGRTGTWSDIGIDTLGYFTGIFLVFLILLILKSKIFLWKNYSKNQAD